MRLQGLLALISLLVLIVKGEAADGHKDDVEHSAGNASVHAGLVAGKSILLAEDERADNATDASEADEGSAAEGSLPLAADVVGLEGHDSGDVCVGSGGDEEDAKVADGRVRVPAHDGQADEAEDHHADDDGAADLVLVAEVAAEEDEEAGDRVGGCNETLGREGLKLEGVDEDQGQRVGQSVADGGGVAEDHGVDPDLPVGATLEEALEVELGHDRVAAVTLDLLDDPVALALAEEAPRLTLGVGEVDQQPVRCDGQSHGDESLHEEDPAPARQASLAVELHETSGEDTGAGRRQAADDVEDRVSLANLVCLVLC